MPNFRTSLKVLAACALLAFPIALAQGEALAQGDDPVLLQLGSYQERSGFVLDRFEIAVRGLAGSQGLLFDPAMLVELYPYLPSFLENRGNEVAMIQAARARGLEADPAAVDAVVAQARANFPEEEAYLELLAVAGFRDEAQLRELVVEGELIQALFASVRADVVISEQEMQVAYQALRPRLVEAAQVCARHILVEDEAGAAAISRAARAGADFGAMATTASIDRGSASRGGDLGCFGRGMMVAPFEEAAFAAEVGVATEPVASQFGYHVLLVYQSQPERFIPLDEVREPLEQQLIEERVQGTVDAIVRNAGVVLYPDRIPAPPTAP